MISKKKLYQIIHLARKCNDCAMSFFDCFEKKEINYKIDDSPVTKADLEVNKLAVNGLQKIFTNTKVVSEEFKKSQKLFQNNKHFWLVDPIDGTKEFINRTPNFTVNFALIKDHIAVFGLISQPFTGTIWYNFRGKAWKLKKNQTLHEAKEIKCSKINLKKIKIFSSSNHRSKELENWISKVKPISDKNIGSSIKFCYLAEGKADLYPRTSPTMEWDTAAGHSILKAAGGNIFSEFGLEIKYGKVDFKNKNFLAFGKLNDRLPSKLFLSFNNINLSTYENHLNLAVKALENKNLVVFPTETVYGIGCIGNSEKAIKSIYLAKQRPSNNPLIAHTYNKKEAEKFVVFNKNAHALADKFWPGPLTIVLQTKKNQIANILSQGKDTLAIRVPSHPVALDLLEKISIPILAPSANKSGGVSPTSAQHVKEDFGPNFQGKGWKLDNILDYGYCEVGIESTVVDCRGENPIILRHGSITTAMISYISKTKLLNLKKSDVLISPGQLKSHYSPKADVYLNQNKIIEGSGLLAFGNVPKSLQNFQNLFNLSPDRNLVQASHLLYSGLRYLDTCGVKVIQVMQIPNKGIGIAINDRLKRASYKA